MPHSSRGLLKTNRNQAVIVLFHSKLNKVLQHQVFYCSSCDSNRFSTFLPDFLKGSNVAKQSGENVKTSNVFIAMKCGKMCTFSVIFMYILNLDDY